MRRLIATMIVMAALVCVARAGWHEKTVTCTHTGTNTALAITQDVSVVKGEVTALHIILDTATDVDVDVTAQPATSTETATTLYTADDVTADIKVYPVFDQHSAAGVALTNDPPRPYICIGDTIRAVISDWAGTTKVVRVRMIWNDDE